MIEIAVRQTHRYREWFASLKDHEGRAAIIARVKRLSLGNPGHTEPVGGGVIEMKIDVGPGYRVYYIKTGRQFAMLLGGGDKATQKQDIKAAKALAKEFKRSRKSEH